MGRQAMVAGNWKMNGLPQNNSELLNALAQKDFAQLSCALVVCPPTVFLSQVGNELPAEFKLGAQNVSAQAQGAHTGEVSADMLKSVGCEYGLVGHSERRQMHHESNSDVAEKTLALLQQGITPIVCVGETLSEREADATMTVVLQQLKAVARVLSAEQLAKIIVAYEPVWAIGTGMTATPEQAQQVHASIRGWLREQIGEQSDDITILYGGSVKGSNAAELFAQEDIDGGLIGGASLNADEFFQICQAAG